jgi:hypothetical protein
MPKWSLPFVVFVISQILFLFFLNKRNKERERGGRS